MPLFKDKFHVSEDLIDDLRSRFLAEVNSSPEEAEKYHPADMKRVKENDWFISRYILHTEKDIDKALNMLKDSLQFRKDMEINTLTRKDLPKDYFSSRAVILYNKDHRDHPIVAIRGKMHIKQEDTRRLQQQYMLYWVEKGIQASDWGVVTILFDCTDAGVSNMDIDMIRFILNVFKRYYPWGLGYFLVCNMPWYLSAFWRMIKQWIPEKYVGKICFVDKKSIREYMDEDHIPLCLGGTCTKMYEHKEGVEAGEESEDEGPTLLSVS